MSGGAHTIGSGEGVKYPSLPALRVVKKLGNGYFALRSEQALRFQRFRAQQAVFHKPFSFLPFAKTVQSEKNAADHHGQTGSKPHHVFQVAAVFRFSQSVEGRIYFSVCSEFVGKGVLFFVDFYFTQFVFNKKRITLRLQHRKIDLNHPHIAVDEQVAGFIAMIQPDAVLASMWIQIYPAELCHK